MTVRFPPASKDNVYEGDRTEVTAQDGGIIPADEGLERAKRCKGYPGWSSPLPDAASAELDFTAGGEHLEFLSLILTEPRQVDIGFSKQHALISFLMRNLEIIMWKYAQRRIPEEVELLQILSPDEIEPQISAAFLSINMDGEYDRLSFHRMNDIRNIAVHRWEYGTPTIRAAAGQASMLSDDTLLQQLELILKVFCRSFPERIRYYMEMLTVDPPDAEVVTDPRYPVTDQERTTVYDLLSPSNHSIESTHQLFEIVQRLGEIASYEYCKRHLPQVLVHYKVEVAEQIELGWWHEIIKDPSNCAPTDVQERAFAAQVSEQVKQTCTRALRNATAHRKMIYLNEDEANKLDYFIDPVVKYVQLLGDEETATKIEQLTAETKAHLVRKYEEWTDLAWCHTRDWRSIRDKIKRRITEWESRLHPLLAKKVCISPVIAMLLRSDERMYTMIRKNGWSMDSEPKSHYYDTPRPPVEYESSEDEAGKGDEADEAHHADATDEVEAAEVNADDHTGDYEDYTGSKWPISNDEAESTALMGDYGSWTDYGWHGNDSEHIEDAKGNDCWVSSSQMDGVTDTKVSW
ncbi:MAG: hypothetical protein L6R41_002178 [Letrouitia leprolyta]|nr:MAG: hypothetical protein L6R41_002178 [Letrouitia leprolyta]